MSQLHSQLLEVGVMFRDYVLGDGLVPTVGFVEEHPLLKEPPEQGAQTLGLLHATV